MEYWSPILEPGQDSIPAAFLHRLEQDHRKTGCLDIYPGRRVVPSRHHATGLMRAPQMPVAVLLFYIHLIQSAQICWKQATVFLVKVADNFCVKRGQPGWLNYHHSSHLITAPGCNFDICHNYQRLDHPRLPAGKPLSSWYAAYIPASVSVPAAEFQ